MKTDYDMNRHKWFPRNDTKEHASYDKHTPDLFKVEFTGNGMVALAPKLYYVLGENKSKFSCKGTQKNNNSYLLNYQNFRKVLMDNLEIYVVKKGMRYIKHSLVYSV